MSVGLHAGRAAAACVIRPSLRTSTRCEKRRRRPESGERGCWVSAGRTVEPLPLHYPRTAAAGIQSRSEPLSGFVPTRVTSARGPNNAPSTW
ncbi:hypothetical protein MRX96_056652 [Rhipicephalus microplus]